MGELAEVSGVPHAMLADGQLDRRELSFSGRDSARNCDSGPIGVRSRKRGGHHEYP
jgi:hypothetical protein